LTRPLTRTRPGDEARSPARWGAVARPGPLVRYFPPYPEIGLSIANPIGIVP
jgi:hypothetical protein